jgi:pimeloyl-ACP methyl ester carboxylesterase
MFLCDGARAQVERPLIVIPGILGSQLGDSRCERMTWGDRNSLWRFEELRLRPDGTETVREHRPCGLIGTVQIVGPLKIDAYADLLVTLNRLEYREGHNLFIFPYDWRRSNFETARKLKEFLDSPALAGRQVDILAHSMGGIVARIYISEFGGSARVGRLVTMGTPHQGSAKMLELLDEGWGFWRNLVAGGLGTVRRTTLTFPAIYELMPRYDYCCVIGEPGTRDAREVSALDPSLWASMPWMPLELRTQAAMASIATSLRNAAKIKEIVGEPLPSSISFYPICGGLIDTAWRIYFDRIDGSIVDKQADRGDGTVHVRSAANGRLDLCRSSTSEHSMIFANDVAREHIEWILRPDLHSFEPRAGLDETRPSFRVETVTGRRLAVNRVALNAEPAAVEAGATFSINLALFGEASLVSADIAATVQLPAHGTRVAFVRTACIGMTTQAQICFSASMQAPSEAGAERFDVNLPGVDAISDILLIL